MSDYRTKAEKDAAERFPRDTAKHKMTVLHDDGLYRHLRFMAPTGGSFYWFDLITLPDSLVFRGDGESFVFTILRAGDLFDLFRRTSYKGSINPGYWSEKLSSERDAATDYSTHLFDEQVKTELAEAEKTFPGVTEAWNEHVGEWSEYNTEYESEARRALDDFTYRPEGAKGERFQFHDTFEWDLKDYAWWFLWACHGIVWGIAQYDAAKATVGVAA